MEGSLVPSCSTHKGKECLVAFDAKLGPKDVISVLSDAQYSNVMHARLRLQPMPADYGCT